MGVTLVGVVLGLPVAARAQYLPSGPGPKPMPEPVPCAPNGSTIPGPLNPIMAPPGPPDELSLPANHSSAFQCPEYAEHNPVYVYLGSLAYQRPRPDHGQVVFQDPALRGLDTGIRPIRQADLNNDVQDYDMLVPQMAFGVAATIGYQVGDCALEATGFYVPRSNTHVDTVRQGRLDLNFFNPPLGFEGDNGLWLQADRVRTTLGTTLASGELNLRYIDKAFAGVEPLIGVRYLNVQEDLSIYTGDDDQAFLDINGHPDPTRQATYTIHTNNNIVAGQLGLELQYPVCCWLCLGGFAKGAWGWDLFQKTTTLTRGDGFLGFDERTHHDQFAHVYELGCYLDFYILEQLRLRGGYNVMWVVNVPEAISQVNFDLANPNTFQKDNGSIFFHGPIVQLQFLF
jgi:hypothetical protein